MGSEEAIRGQMQDTRSSLTEKLETLEGKVTSTVHDATSTVADAVGAVKSTVEDTLGAVKSTMQHGVRSVKDFLDIPAHVDNHPWAMVGGSVALGFAAGMLLGGGRRHTTHGGRVTHGSPTAATAAAATAASSWAATPSRTNGRHESVAAPVLGLLSRFAPEISKLKSMVIGALVNAARDKVMQAAPAHMKSSLEEFFAGVSEKVTGKSDQADTKHEEHDAGHSGSAAAM